MPSPNPRYRQLTDSLAMIEDGKLNDEGGRELNAAIAAVEATQKPATVTITLKISMAAKNSEMIKIDPVVTSKLPKANNASSLFFVDEDHNITQEKKQSIPRMSAVEGFDKRAAN